MDNTTLTSKLMDIKLGDLYQNCINSFIKILEEITTLWSIKKKDINISDNIYTLDFSTKVYNILVKILNILTKDNRGIYLGILLIFFSFVLFNFYIFWQSS